MAPSSDKSEFLGVLALAQNVVILAGAGLSAGSGIRTYRGAGGLWINNDPERLATPEGFNADPGSVWRFYQKRIQQCREAKPNEGHRAIASLAIPEVQSRLLPSLDPKWTPPLFVTQNFDGLSIQSLHSLVPQLSPDQLALAESRLIETHGSAFRTLCTQCKCTRSSLEPLSCPAFDDSYAVEDGKMIPVGDLPRCGGREWSGSNRYGRCGGLLRPGVVWFGEVPEQQGEIMRILNWADVLIVVGTSSLVHPAATYAGTVRDRGGKVAVFNLEAPGVDQEADFVFVGPCEETLPEMFCFAAS